MQYIVGAGRAESTVEHNASSASMSLMQCVQNNGVNAILYHKHHHTVQVTICTLVNALVDGRKNTTSPSCSVKTILGMSL